MKFIHKMNPTDDDCDQMMPRCSFDMSKMFFTWGFDCIICHVCPVIHSNALESIWQLRRIIFHGIIIYIKVINRILTLLLVWIISILRIPLVKALVLRIPFVVTVFELRDEVKVEITIHINLILENCILK